MKDSNNNSTTCHLVVSSSVLVGLGEASTAQGTATSEARWRWGGDMSEARWRRRGATANARWREWGALNGTRM